MYKKTEIRDKIWIIPLNAGIIALIAVFFPTAHVILSLINWDWWMWNFTSMGVVGYSSVGLFVNEVDFIIISIITTSAVLLSAVNLLILSIRTKRRNLNTKYFELMSIISAVLSISVMIYYIIAMDIAFYDGLTIEGTTFDAGYHFWFLFRPGLGIFLPFISAALSFVGVGVFRYYSKLKEDIIPPKMETIKEYTSVLKTMGSLNYCSECGYKILQADARFCTNCGFKF